MLTGLTWKAETTALLKLKQSADKRLGILHTQHGHVSSPVCLFVRCLLPVPVGFADVAHLTFLIR